MANYSRWDEIKKQKSEPAPTVRASIEQDLALGQVIYDMRTEAGLSQRVLAERMGTTQSVISRLEEGGGDPVRAGVVTSLELCCSIPSNYVVQDPPIMSFRTL